MTSSVTPSAPTRACSSRWPAPTPRSPRRTRCAPARAALFDSGQHSGAEANTAEFLASEAGWQAANVCLDIHGGNGFVDTWDVERKFRETRLYQVAPVNNNLILAFLGQHVLGLPRSY
ncbi:hypothetical protein Ssi03_33840 [Sphaerisporangium siamense]|uniref:Alkylation response protein AidB-like acyl-CoA dehydrogenase n=1 Tax=Sphaerisporangium siamense TaxID=795645 RepID=A0A7W7G7I7_9ACTN|nr:acyl-CoA dehydrogenase family protein [Sphaerisporangium siamense]MBB4698545.1 alkylation response protein AidB-like acyl-CoA dehydrogenase [Sphaerisporangium siamense]GII85394.1 hypothetical protein Ssi03_33840 [Sphaerisporangium siamense]